MDYQEFLTRIVDDGIAAARESYREPQDALKLQGSVEGFEACRGKAPDQLAQLLTESRRKTLECARVRPVAAILPRASGDEALDEELALNQYWRLRCFELEVEWTSNCVSAMLMNQGLPTIVPPTARAVLKVADVVGVGDARSHPRFN